MFQIEHDIPLPRNPRCKGQSKYPFGSMAIGNSFIVGHTLREAMRVRSALNYFLGKPINIHKRFIVQHVGDDVWRCWRVQDIQPTVQE